MELWKTSAFQNQKNSSQPNNEQTWNKNKKNFLKNKAKQTLKETTTTTTLCCIFLKSESQVNITFLNCTLSTKMNKVI